MSKHTPGKWKVRLSGEVGTDNELIASIYPIDNAKIKKANAHLIASAPELLEACKRAEVFANATILATPTGKYRNKLTEINILRLQAIAKAEGGD